MMQNQVVLEVSNLNKSFGTKNVLNDFNMKLEQGENLVILGKSGSGKSVLIKCIIGLMQPDSGSITVLGKQLESLNQKELDHLRSRVGFLFQSNALYDSMSVRENLEFPLRRHHADLNTKEREKLIQEVLTHVGLIDTIDLMPSELSGGMRKRIALARTLILKPEIILYDEPTTGLDPITAREISELMIYLQKEYRTSSIIISHDLTCVKLVGNRIIMLIDGKCHTSGTFDNLTQSTDPAVKQFFD